MCSDRVFSFVRCYSIARRKEYNLYLVEMLIISQARVANFEIHYLSRELLDVEMSLLLNLWLHSNVIIVARLCEIVVFAFLYDHTCLR